MNLHRKTLLFVGATFIAMVAILIITSDVFVLGGFEQLEAEETRINVRRGINEISVLAVRMESVAGDWAPWDDTYDFVRNAEPTYVEDNLNVSTIVNLDVNFMFFFDRSEQLVHGVHIDLAEKTEVAVPAGLLQAVRNKLVLGHKDLQSKIKGILVVESLPVVIASQPILKSDFTGPIAGTLVVGRVLDPAFLKQLSRRLQISIGLRSANEKNLPPDYQKAINRLADTETIVVEPEGDRSIAGYAVLQDISGNPALVLKVSWPRKIYARGKLTSTYYMLAIIIIGVVFIGLILLMLAKGVLSPLSRLTARVTEIARSGGFDETIPVERRDELGTLACEINAMLKQISAKSLELSKINQELRNEIDERVLAERTLQESDRRLREQFSALSELSQIKLHQYPDLHLALRQVNEKVAATLGVERVSAWLYDRERMGIRCIALYELSSRRHSDGTELFAKDYPLYFEALKEQRIIAADDAKADPRTREFAKTYLAPQNISSMLDAQIRIAGRPAGVVCIEHVGAPRQWTIDEQSFAGSIADLFSLIIEIFEHKRVTQERESLQAQLQRAEKMEVIGTLAGGVAHDLNNILSGLTGYPELLLIDLPEDSPLRKPLLTIKKSGEKASAIVQDLLTLTRRGVTVTEVVNLNRIISDYLESPEHEKVLYYNPGVRVETNLEIDLLNIIGSPVHLSKTVMNLVRNSVEAMPDGGTIVISSESQYLEKPITGYDRIREGEYVVLSVADTGVGIASENLERIFEPFYTKKVMGASGTGLGMAVVWGVVKDHRGYIDVQSVEGEGTTFRLYFPVTRKGVFGEQSRVAIESYMGRGESVLVVDDVEEQREVAGNMLQRLGYRVDTVSSGEAAVEYLKANSVDLVVLDMIMAPGIDGLDTIRLIYQHRPQQKVIIASGFSETERVVEAQKLGAGEYLRKPYSLEKIGVAIRNELAK